MKKRAWQLTANKLSQIFRDLNGRPFHNHLVKLKLLNINVIQTFLEFSGWRWRKIMTFDKLWASKTEDSSTILFLGYWCALASGLEKKSNWGPDPWKKTRVWPTHKRYHGLENAWSRGTDKGSKIFPARHMIATACLFISFNRHRILVNIITSVCAFLNYRCMVRMFN